MKELKQSKKRVFEVLGIILKSYASYKEALKLSDEETTKRILDSYNDYYEWLQDEI